MHIRPGNSPNEWFIWDDAGDYRLNMVRVYNPHPPHLVEIWNMDTMGRLTNILTSYTTSHPASSILKQLAQEQTACGDYDWPLYPEDQD